MTTPLLTGLDLDRAIAERKGWKHVTNVHPQNNTLCQSRLDGQDPNRRYALDTLGNPNVLHRVPFWSTDPALALGLLGEMDKDVVLKLDSYEGKGKYSLWPILGIPSEWVIYHNDFCIAIGNAWLQWDAQQHEERPDLWDDLQPETRTDLW